VLVTSLRLAVSGADTEFDFVLMAMHTVNLSDLADIRVYNDN